MGYRLEEFAPGEIYHAWTRGVEKRRVFEGGGDKDRFISVMLHCLSRGQVMSYSAAKKLKIKPTKIKSGEGLVDLLAYCLMDNHIHWLVKENVEKGISVYFQRVLNSYAKHFNMREDRSGSLFLSPFKAVLVDGDEYFLHISRYIHLNPHAAHMVDNPFGYKWSSLSEYVDSSKGGICHVDLVRSMMSVIEYRKFVVDEADYARSLAEVQHLLID